METAAAAAPEAPATSTVALLDVVAATPKISPKIETVPSIIPKTMVPAEAISELFSRFRIGGRFHRTTAIRRRKARIAEFP